MPSDFLRGQIRLLLKRCRTLQERLSEIDRLPRGLNQYIKAIATELSKLSLDIEQLLQDPNLGSEFLLKNQIQYYRRLIESVDIIETCQLTVLEQFNPRDEYFYRFAQLFCQQTCYPYPSPIVSSHSEGYFYTRPTINIIWIPLCEDCFLLAIPDFVHELGHLFYDRHKEEIVEPFAKVMRRHFQGVREEIASGLSSRNYEEHFRSLEQDWLQAYIVEFFCDMFATYLVGAAYGWSHIRLVLASETDIYSPGFDEEERGTHPADEARMRGVLATLRAGRESNSSESLSSVWERVKKAIARSPEPEYEYCYPDLLLESLANLVVAICSDRGLVPYYQQPRTDTNLPQLMQQAWEQFHGDSESYPDWETERIEAVKTAILR